MTRLVDVVGSATKNGLSVHPPHDCEQVVGMDGRHPDGRCPECEALARYVLVQLGTVGVEITQGRHC